MNLGQTSYFSKYKELKLQNKLYRNYLSKEGVPGIKRDRILSEIARILNLIKEIEQLPVYVFFTAADDYIETIESFENPKTKLAS